MAITVMLNIESTMKTALSLLATMLVATLTSASAVATQCNLNSQYLKAEYTITNTTKISKVARYLHFGVITSKSHIKAMLLLSCGNI